MIASCSPSFPRDGWQSLKTFFKSSTSAPKAVRGAVIAIQRFGDFLGFHPHLHVFISDGCFHESCLFTVSPTIDTKTLKNIFRRNVLKMLLTRGKITTDLIKKIAALGKPVSYAQICRKS